MTNEFTQICLSCTVLVTVLYISLYDGELVVDTIDCMGCPLCGIWAGHSSVEGLSIGELGSHITRGLGVLCCVGI